MMHHFNKKKLEKTIKDIFFIDEKVNGSIIVATGKGGVREFVKSIDLVFGDNGEITFRKLLTVFRNGWVVKQGNVYILK